MPDHWSGGVFAEPAAALSGGSVAASASPINGSAHHVSISMGGLPTTFGASNPASCPVSS